MKLLKFSPKPLPVILVVFYNAPVSAHLVRLDDTEIAS